MAVMTDMGATGFFDVSLSDLIDGYVELEKAKNTVESGQIAEAPKTQDKALHEPDYVSGSEAIEGGNAAVPGAATTAQADYWSRIPKPLLYGSLGLLGLGLVLKAVK